MKILKNLVEILEQEMSQDSNPLIIKVYEWFSSELEFLSKGQDTRTNTQKTVDALKGSILMLELQYSIDNNAIRLKVIDYFKERLIKISGDSE